MKKRLIIIGNGFDLHHHMKTQYIDYRDYLIKTGKKDIVDCYEISMEGDGDEELVCFLWSRLESTIAILPYEQAYSFLVRYDDEKWSNSSHHDFQHEIEKMAKYWPGLKDNLKPWVLGVRYTSACENLKAIINEESNYISFNYTNTLEKLYGINKNDICYIHGDASTDDELILGHRNESYYPEWDDNNTDTDIRLLNSGVFMDSFRKETYKPIERISRDNKKYKKFIHEYDYSEVYIMGLSYNDTDSNYIEKIAKAQNAKWYLVCYSDDDYKKAANYADNIGMKNYSLTAYDDIC